MTSNRFKERRLGERRSGSDRRTAAPSGLDTALVVPATDFARRIATHIDAAQSRPVVVQAFGRRRAVLLSPAAYDALTSRD